MSLKTKKNRKLSRPVTASSSAGRIGPPDVLSRWALTGGAGLIVLGALCAWHNSFFGPFVLDDRSSIVSNPTIRRLGHILEALSARHPGLTVSGRPIVNLSLAINYALSGTEVWSYHALNLAIHILAGLTLFGIVRRTLQKPLLRTRFKELRMRGVNEVLAAKTAGSPHGPWRLSQSPALCIAFPNAYFNGIGLFRLAVGR